MERIPVTSKRSWRRHKTSFGSAVPRAEAYYGDPAIPLHVFAARIQATLLDSRIAGIERARWGSVLGDWKHFVQYVAVLNWFVPKVLIKGLAVLETVIEFGLGVALLLALLHHWAIRCSRRRALPYFLAQLWCRKTFVLPPKCARLPSSQARARTTVRPPEGIGSRRYFHRSGRKWLTQAIAPKSDSRITLPHCLKRVYPGVQQRPANIAEPLVTPLAWNASNIGSGTLDRMPSSRGWGI